MYCFYKASDRMRWCAITSYGKIRILNLNIKSFFVKKGLHSFPFFPSEIMKTSNKTRRKHALFVHFYFSQN